ncbi:MAG: PQQ-binding-like beta-propeller repeat protein [Planctomycetaceae bacterium]
MRSRCAVVFVCCFGAWQNLSADDWPQFLGPERNGVSSETGLIEELDSSGGDILWKQPLGVGMSGIAISNGLAVTLYQNDTSQFLTALDADSGAKKWETVVAPAYENAMGNGPRATPTVADGTVYAFTGEGILVTVAMDDGRLLWSVNATKELFCKPSEYGMSSSPLVTDGKVIVQVGSHRGTVAAFDCRTGKQQWTAGDGTAGYSSPMLAELAGTRQIVALAGKEVLGIAPADGSVLWAYPFETEYDCNTATPVRLSDSRILISAGENHGSVILDIAKANDGFSATPTWESLAKDSVLRAEWQTPVVLNGHVYALDNMGSAGPITNLVCLRLSDGEQVWSQPRFGKSNLILADGKLFLSTMRGELVIVRATPEGFQETGRTIVTGMTRQAPSLANGKLYLRDDEVVVCVQVSAKP